MTRITEVVVGVHIRLTDADMLEVLLRIVCTVVILREETYQHLGIRETTTHTIIGVDAVRRGDDP